MSSDDHLALRGDPDEPEATRRAAPASTAVQGPRVPGYRLTRLLGRGGQGQVWQAIHLASSRKIALKIIRPDRLGDSKLRARFEQERHTLKLLEHPAIVHAIDEGELPSGELWHATEYVPGRPLDEYVHELDRQALADGTSQQRGAFPVRQVLGLFIGVCDAVQTAHHVGVVHRDLKPSNIVVDDDGQPHLLDFGLAKLSEVDSPDLVTLTGEFLGSPAWASPEQVEAQPERIDVRSDVYSLGVILYQLLTGTFPYDVTGPVPQVFDQIRYAEPTSPRKHAAYVDDELETVLLTTLAKERERRYQTVAALRDDLERYLRNEPIGAKGDSRWYLFRKFASKHRALTAAAAATFLLSIAYGVDRHFAAGRERAIRQEAELARDKAQEIRTFLQTMLESIDPAAAQGRDTTVLREMLADAADRVEAELSDQPEVAAAIQGTIGEVYVSIGEYRAAIGHLDAALSTSQTLFGEQHEDVAKLKLSLGIARLEMDQLEDAEHLLREALATFRRLHGDQHADVAECLHNLAGVLTRAGQYGDARTMFRESLEMRKALFGEKQPVVAEDLLGLGEVAYREGESERAQKQAEECRAMFEEAASRFEAAVSIWHATLGPAHPHTITGTNDLALATAAMGEQQKALAILEENLAATRRVLGPDHPWTAQCLNNLGYAHSRLRDHASAERMLREALGICRRKLPQDHAQTVNTANTLAHVLMRAKKRDQAIMLFQEAVRGYGTRYGDNDRRTLDALYWLGDQLGNTGRAEEAEAAFRECVPRMRRVYGPDHNKTITAERWLSSILYGQGHYAEAEEMFRYAAESLRRTQGDADGLMLIELGNVGSALLKQDKFTEAERVFREQLELVRAGRPDDHEALARALVHLGVALLKQDRPGEAEPFLRECVQVRRENLPKGNWNTAVAESHLGACLTAQQRFDEAEPLLLKSYSLILAARGAKDRFTEGALERLVGLYEAWGKPDHAAEWRAKPPASQLTDSTQDKDEDGNQP